MSLWASHQFLVLDGLGVGLMRFVGLLMAGLWLLVGSVFWLFAGPAAGEAGPGGLHGSVGVNSVVESYARDFVVSYEEAERRLGRVGVLQEMMASIRALERDRVAGWGIDHGENFGAWVWLTGDRPASAAAVEIAARSGDMEIRTGAVHTYAELRAAQDRFDPDAIVQAMGDAEAGSRVAGMVVLTGVDMGSNSVSVTIDPAGGSGGVRRGAGSESAVMSDEKFEAETAWLTGVAQDYLDVGIKVTDGRGFDLHADFMGGEVMWPCMSGFAAKHSKGHYGLLTAGHCVEHPQLHGTWLDLAIGGPTRRADAQFNRIPHGGIVHTLTDDYKCNDSGGVCDVTGTIERTEMLGDYVCHNLVIGGISCGLVTDISARDFVKVCEDEDGRNVTCDPVFVIVRGDSLRLCKGDSGSPWYNHAGIAYGIHSGGSAVTEDCVTVGGHWAVFSAIKEVEAALDVKVLTDDPSPPSAIINLKKSVRVDGVYLSWDPPAEGAWNYIVNRRIANSSQKYSQIFETRTHYYLDRAVDLIPGIEYEYEIIAQNNLYMKSDSRYISATAPITMTVDHNRIEVNLYWYLPSKDIEHYEVYRRVGKPGYSYTKIATVKSTEKPIYRHPVSDLTPGVEYYYRVRAITDSGEISNLGSNPNNYARLVIPPARNLRVVLKSTTAELSWITSYGGIKSYEVYRRPVEKGASYSKIGTSKTQRYSDPVSGLTPGVEYYYRLKPVSSAGVVGSWGPGNNYASLVMPAALGLKTTRFSGGVRVSWDVPVGDVASYKVYRRVAKPGEVYVEVAEREVPYYWEPVSGLTPGVEYYYRIRTVNGAGVVGGWGPGNNYISVVMPAALGLKTTRFSGGVRVSWDVPVGDVASYKVYRRVARSGEVYVEVAEREVPYYWEPVSGLTPGVEYYYRVKAVGSAGVVGSWGPGNNYVSVVMPAALGLKTTRFSDGVRVSWDVPVGDVASYRVYRRVARSGEVYVEVAEREVPYYWDPVSGLTPGVEYYYRVKAVGSAGVVGSWGSGNNYVSVRVPK